MSHFLVSILNAKVFDKKNIFYVSRTQYVTNGLETTLTDIHMDSAGYRNTGQGKAAFVEECSCPPGYTGLSCEVTFYFNRLIYKFVEISIFSLLFFIIYIISICLLFSI